MSKYIIELDGRIKLVTSVGVTENGVVYTTSDYVHNLEELNSDYINEHYGELQDEAYKQGYAEAERIWRAPSSDNEFYQKGLEDAWVAVRKIVSMPDDPYWELFGDYKADIIKNTTVSEVIAKLKAYEGKHSDRIEVGDEVRAEEGHVFVVTGITDKGSIYGFDKDGMWLVRVKDRLRKTGKHYDIASILEAMRK